MATMDDKALFVDTNVLVYANVIETPFHEQALATIKTAHQAGRTLWTEDFERFAKIIAIESIDRE